MKTERIEKGLDTDMEQQWILQPKMKHRPQKSVAMWNIIE